MYVMIDGYILSSRTPCYFMLPVSEITSMHFKMTFFSLIPSCIHHAMFKSTMVSPLSQYYFNDQRLALCVH